MSLFSSFSLLPDSLLMYVTIPSFGRVNTTGLPANTATPVTETKTSKLWN